MTNNRFLPYLVLMAGVLIVSSSSIFIRFAQAEAVSSLVIAAWRLIVASLILTPVACLKRSAELRGMGRSRLGWCMVSGLFLAVHLASWITSLSYTSVASSTALVCTYPLWVAMMDFLLFRERLSRYTMIGLAVALTGTLLITLSDSGTLSIDPLNPEAMQFKWQNMFFGSGNDEDTAILGNALALLGGIAGAGYFIVGRYIRRQMSNTAYIWPVYSVAMIVLFFVTLLARQPLTGHSAEAYFWLILIGIGPQLLGHSAFNWTLAHMSTTFVVLSILGEPVGSAVLAYFVFGETFVFVQLAGFVFLLFGIGFGVMGEQK